MKKIAILMSAVVALLSFASCDNDRDKVDLDNVAVAGFYVAGPATGYDGIDARCSMVAGFNETKHADGEKIGFRRTGMYEKYIILEKDKDFYLVLNEAGSSTRYSATLNDLDLAALRDSNSVAFGENPAITVKRGELKINDETIAMRVDQTGLYHIVLDLDDAGDLPAGPQILVAPCHFELAAGISSDGLPMEETVSADGKVYTWTYQGTGDRGATNFKFRYAKGWKITLDDNGDVKAEISLGWDKTDNTKLTPNDGQDIPLNPSKNLKITLRYEAKAGGHSASFSYTVEGDQKDYGPKDWMVGLSGDLHPSSPSWGDPLDGDPRRAVYSATESDVENGIYVYNITALPINKDAKFKLRRNGDWLGAGQATITGVTTTGENGGDITFGGESGAYDVKITIVSEDALTVKSYTAVFTANGTAPEQWPLIPSRTGVKINATYLDQSAAVSTEGYWGYAKSRLRYKANDEFTITINENVVLKGGQCTVTASEGVTISQTDGENFKFTAVPSGKIFNVTVKFKYAYNEQTGAHNFTDIEANFEAIDMTPDILEIGLRGSFDWSNTTRAIYDPEKSANGVLVYVLEDFEFGADTEFKFYFDGDWKDNNQVTTTGASFGSKNGNVVMAEGQTGVYDIEFSLKYDFNTSSKSDMAVKFIKKN